MRSAYFFILISLSMALPTTSILARPSPEERATARSAFWGLFADTYLALDCFEQGGTVKICVERRLSQASRHAEQVDFAAAKTGAQFLPRLLAVQEDLKNSNNLRAKEGLLTIRADLIESFAAATAPAVVPDLKRGSLRYQEHCASCHGSIDGSPGALQKKLKIIPQPLNAAWRQNVQSPLGVYATLIHGVDGSEMLPLVEVLDIDELWSIAFYISAIGLKNNTAMPDQEFLDWIQSRSGRFSLVDLARSSDLELAAKIRELGRECGDCLPELSYLRSDWLAKAPRLGDYAKDERKAKEARGLTILITLITLTSIGFGVILSRRSRLK
jgi:mono/diheme cytochrome c family protein